MQRNENLAFATAGEKDIGDAIRYDGDGAVGAQSVIPEAQAEVRSVEPAYDLRQRPRKRERYSPDQSPIPTPQLTLTIMGPADERSMFGSSPLSSLPPSPSPSPSVLRPKHLSSQASTAADTGLPIKKRKLTIKSEVDTNSKPKIPKPRKIYSSWSCRPVPPNIMDMLRFDHPPEIMNAPRPVLPDYPEETIYQPHTCRVRPARNPSQRTAKPKKDQPGAVAQRKKARVKAENDENDEIGIVPLPSELPFDLDGIRSSKFCAVLRILAGLPKPPPKRSKEVQLKPTASPPVWAESRQELCEALPYYRSFQSGLYMHSRVAFGYLLEAYPAPRDIWAHDGRVVISHGGGQCIRTVDPYGRPGVALQADQSRSDARVDTLLNAHERRTPIVLIAGAGYDFLPWQLDCAYIVLGWYWISMAWVEAEPAVAGTLPPPGRNYFHRYKIRFDWVQSQGEPWWHDHSGSTPVSNSVASPAQNGTNASLTLTSPPRTPSSSSPGETRSPQRDIATLLNPVGLLTPPLSSPSSSKDLVEGDETLPLSKEQENKRDLDDTPDPPSEEMLTCGMPRIDVSDVTPHRKNSSATQCSTCDRPIVQVYEEGAICLRQDCPAFFMLPTELGLMPIPPGFSLTYVQNFLEPTKTPQEIRIPYGVIPPEPVRTMPETGTGQNDQTGVGSRTLWRGWVCKKCGRANCRYRWEVWECRNCGNQFAHLDPEHIISAHSLRPTTPAFMGDAKIDSSACISIAVRSLGKLGAILCIYNLAEGQHSGKVYHLSNCDLAVADELFEEYQREAARGGWFQRRPIKANTVKGQLLAQHFAVNSGASYKYIVDTMSFSFDDSPPCVMKALRLIMERVNLVLEEQVRFNEILSVMYREGQKMSWHDDGEQGLGPVVASLSLGSPAIMSFRPKQPRIEPNEHFKTGIPVTRHTPPTALSLTLSHGDILVMEGSDIQRLYDHRVIPQGFRVAATARVIGQSVS
ncbi:hypothetical protein IAT40_001828 [Kwoniella sp. CBS 6097]